jgi:hypothetical protein
MEKLDAHCVAGIKKVAKRLKELRIEAGYTSYESFANDHDLPRVQYWRMERGTNFRFSSFLILLDKHKITMTEFFDQLE